MSLSLVQPVLLICVLLCAPTAHGNGEIQPLTSDSSEFLTNLFNWFLPEFENMRACHHNKQFAVMTFSVLQGDGLVPYFTQNVDSISSPCSFVATVPQPQDSQRGRKEHTEIQLIRVFNSLSNCESEFSPNTVYLFTFNSPCLRCAMALQQLARNNPGTTFYIGYARPYGNTLNQAEQYLREGNIRLGQVGDLCPENRPNDDLKRKRSSLCTVVTCQPYCGSWGSWSSCSRSCGGGWQYRYRSCVGGSDCCASTSDCRRCGTQSCPSCFASDSMVRVKLLTNNDTQIQPKRIDELKVGDYVESYDRETNSVAFSEVYFISHDGDTRNSSRLIKLIVGYDHGKELSLRLHAKHLVYSCQTRITVDRDTMGYKEEPCRYPPEYPMTADSVKVGDTLWVRNSAGEFSPRLVIRVGEAWSGIRHPMTLNHYIVVDDVLASVHMYDEGLYRQITAPIRMAYGISPSITDTVLFKRLVQMWDSVEDKYF